MIGKTEIEKRIRMIVRYKKPAVIGTAVAIVLSLAVCLLLLTDTNLKTSRNTLSNSTANSKVSNTAASNSTLNEKNILSLDNFYPVENTITKTFYSDIHTNHSSLHVNGSYDFDSDGKEDNFSINFTDASENGTKSTISVGSAKASQELVNLAGVYAIDLDKSDSLKELAIVEYGFDNYVTTHFYRYDHSKLELLGSISGGIESDNNNGYNFAGYNFQIQTDGKGRVIPEFGIMKYVSPNVLLNAYELKGLKLSEMSIDLKNVLNRTYTISVNIKPYFEQGKFDVKNFSGQYKDSDIISLSTGDKIKLINIDPSAEYFEYSNVELPDGRQGILYFFLHP